MSRRRVCVACAAALSLAASAYGCGNGSGDVLDADAGDDGGGDEGVVGADDGAGEAGDATVPCDGLGAAFAAFAMASDECTTADDCVVAWTVGDCDCAPTFPGEWCAVGLRADHDRTRLAELARVLDECSASGGWDPRICDCGPPCRAGCTGGRCTAACDSCLAGDADADGDDAADSDTP